MNKLIKRIYEAFAAKNKNATARRIAQRVEEEMSLFNILRIGDTDYITYQGFIISRESDEDLLDRLAELRAQAARQIRVIMEGLI